MSAIVSEWAIRPGDFTQSPIIVPLVAAPPCLARHEFAWLCGRPPGHGGRHAARVASGEVVAVWS